MASRPTRSGCNKSRVVNLWPVVSCLNLAAQVLPGKRISQRMTGGWERKPGMPGDKKFPESFCRRIFARNGKGCFHNDRRQSRKPDCSPY